MEKELDNNDILLSIIESMMKMIEKTNDFEDKEDFDFFITDLYSELIVMKSILKNQYYWI